MRTLSVLVLAALTADAAAQASWSIPYPTGSPLPRMEPSLVCFEPTGDVLMLFGVAGGQPVTQNWKLHGNTWSTFPAPPPPWGVAKVVYDSVRQRVVAFSGETSNNDIWEWNGVQWMHPNPAVRPAARSACAMAFDRARGVTVVFGGVDNGGNFLQDLWEWNGTTWLQRAAITPLGPRVNPVAAFDPMQQNVIVHGGLALIFNTSLVFNDTWAWDGVAWTQHTPATPPPYDTAAVLVTDLHRQRVVRYGGTSGSTATWEWDGAEWGAVTSASPGSRVSHDMAYDTAGRRVVMFGGRTVTGFMVQDTWIYRTPLPADLVPYGNGCAGTAGVPQLAGAPYTLPWLGDTTRHRVNHIAAGEPGAVFVSSFTQLGPVSLATAGMPGCDLLLSIDVAEFRVAVAGVAEWALALPNIPSLASVPFYQQAFLFDVVANTLGLTASNGIVVTPGIR